MHWLNSFTVRVICTAAAGRTCTNLPGEIPYLFLERAAQRLVGYNMLHCRVAKLVRWKFPITQVIAILDCYDGKSIMIQIGLLHALLWWNINLLTLLLFIMMNLKADFHIIFLFSDFFFKFRFFWLFLIFNVIFFSKLRFPRFIQIPRFSRKICNAEDFGL